METMQFDDFARQVGHPGTSRRSALRCFGHAVLGGALSAAASRLGIAEDAAAKAHRRGKTATKRRTAHAADGKRGRLHAEGKGKGKKKRKKDKSPPLPPGCQRCNGCQMCQDGACVPDLGLDGVRCEGSGAACGYCSGGVCTPTERQPCNDGICPPYGKCCEERRQCADKTCVAAGECCPEEFKCLPDGPCVGRYDCCPDEGPKKCTAPESPRGIYCVEQNVCCVDRERMCADGSCISREACCPEQRRCSRTVCVGNNECCPGEKPCAGGTCVAQDACCPDQWQCQDGACVGKHECCENERKCADGSCVSAGACCSGEKLCPDGACVGRDQCCPEEAPPVCGECKVARCAAGKWGCFADATCGPSCGEGYCPLGMLCHHEGTCCGVPEGGTYWTCICASGYSNPLGCNAYGACCRYGCCYPFCCPPPGAQPDRGSDKPALR